MAAASEVALDHGPTRRRLDAVRRGAWLALLGGLLVTALAAGGLRSEHRRETALRATLEATTGRVAQVVPAGMLDAGSLRVRVDGREVVVPADLDRETWSPGDEVALLVSPSDPTVVRRTDLPGRSGGGALVALLLAGPVAVVAGALTVQRAARWRRVLARHPWERTSAVYRERPGRFLRAELALGGEDAVLRVEPTPRWSLAALRTEGVATYWVAGPPDGYRVVSRPGVPSLVGARPAEG